MHQGQIDSTLTLVEDRVQGLIEEVKNDPDGWKKENLIENWIIFRNSLRRALNANT